MRLSFNWLNDYINLENENPVDIALKFTMASAEVEEVEDLSKFFTNVVTAKILKIEQHLYADRLKVTKVFDGKEEFQVVCGANNIKEGQIVPLAKVGAILPGNFKIKVSNKRGIESFGMLCSGAELGINNDEEGILILPEDAPIGMPFSKYIGKDDFIIIIDNKSITHRPDLWGHYGIARELSAILKKDFKKLDFTLPKIDKKIDFKITVEDKNLCPRYSAVVIDNIEIKESPKWLQNRLINIGSRPINNVVDATNYVMFELGQPLHAFDYNKIDSEIIIRRATNEEKIILLDKSEKVLSNDMLLIADKSKPIALAGIMGASNSEVDNNTTRIILESANFHASNIRKTSIKLGIRTEASSRFEKSLDSNLTIQAISRFYNILKETCPNIKCISDLYDLNYLNNKPILIDITLDFVNKKLGTIIDKKFFEETLTSLGFKIIENFDDNYKIEVPSYRATKDISIPEDIVEEIGRIYGYDNIDPKAPLIKINPIQEKEIHLLRRNIRNNLSTGLGFIEVYNYSFNSREQIEKLNLDLDKHIKVKNPLSSQQEYLRTSLIPNMLLNIEKNYRNFDNFSIYEIGKVFIKEDNSFKEKEFLCSMIYCKKTDEPIFYRSKESLNYLLYNLGILDFDIEYTNENDLEAFYHPGRTGLVKQRKLLIAKVSEIHPKVMKLFNISGHVGIFYLDLNSIILANKRKIKFKELPKYPYVPFDVSVIVDKKTTVKEVKELIHKVDKDKIQSVEIFDIYEGSNLPENKKSFAFNIKLYSKNKTLEYEEIKKLENSIIENLNKFYQVRM